MWIGYYVLVILAILSPSQTLDNGLALTPPMGWMSWHRYRCTIDCLAFPNDCISEDLVKRTADSLVYDGYLAAGYEYVIIDDCWMARERDQHGRLQADAKRFPNGMKSLSAYIHRKGLKFGLYQSYSEKTCEGYPGLRGHLDDDARLFAEWGVDYVKIDACTTSLEDLPGGFQSFGASLNRTGRPIVYSCSWPYYEEQAGQHSDYKAVSKICNTWRSWNDVTEAWSSVQSIISWTGNNQNRIIGYTGPGRWNDPDMLTVGNPGLSDDQAKTQMAIWAILAAPLLMSADIARVNVVQRGVLLNKGVIAVNQDPLGMQGGRVYQKSNLEIWIRPISPKIEGFLSHAIAVVYHRMNGPPARLSISLIKIGLNAGRYIMVNLFEPNINEDSKPIGWLDVQVNPSGVVLLRATPVARTKPGTVSK